MTISFGKIRVKIAETIKKSFSSQFSGLTLFYDFSMIIHSSKIDSRENEADK